MILDQAFRYITELKKQNDTMLLEGGDKVQGKGQHFKHCFCCTACLNVFYSLFFNL